MQISQIHWLILIDIKPSSILSPNKYCQATAAMEITIRYQIGFRYSLKVFPKILIFKIVSKRKPKITNTKTKEKTRSSRLFLY